MSAYRALPDLMRMGPLSGGSVLAYSPFTRRVHALTESDWARLGQCLTAAPLEQHAARLTPEQVARWVDEQLLLPESMLVPFGPAVDDTPATITRRAATG